MPTRRLLADLDPATPVAGPQPADARPARDCRPASRSPARISRTLLYELIEPGPGRTGPRPRAPAGAVAAATCSSTSRRIRGSTNGGLEYLLGVRRAVRGRAPGTIADLGPRPRPARRPRSRAFIDLVMERLDARSGDARLPLRRLRGGGDQAPDAAPRDARGRGRPAPPRRDPRRPATTSSARASARRSSRTRSRRSRSSTCPLARARSPRPASSVVAYETWLRDDDDQHLTRPRRLQPRRLRLDLDAPRLARGAPRREAIGRAAGRWTGPTSRTGCPARRRPPAGRDRAPGRGAHGGRSRRSADGHAPSSAAGGCSPSSSTGTAATRSPSGGTSTGSTSSASTS